MAIQQPVATDPLNNPDHSLSHRVFANDNAAPAQSVVVDASGNTTLSGTLASSSVTTTTQKASGIHRSSSITYISGTGTAGVDNTAATIRTLSLPANSLTQVGDRLRIRSYFQATGGSAITGAQKLGPAASEVLVGDTAVNSTNLSVTETWLHYIDNTHANIIENENGALGTLSAANVAGFAWNGVQNIIFTQSQVINQHLVLYALIIDIFPKGIV